MVVLCYGMPRSASTYIWQIVHQILQPTFEQYSFKNALPEHLSSDYIHDAGDMIQELIENVPESFIYITKTHGHYDPVINELANAGKLKVIISYRNPYDIIKSWEEIVAKEREKPSYSRREGFAEVECFDDILERVARDVGICKKWIDGVEEALHFNFEVAQRSHENNVRKIAKFLEFDDFNFEEVVAYFSNTSNIVEYNKGVSGRGERLNSMEYPRFSRQFNQFISKYLD